MATPLDLNQRPIRTWRLAPPEVVVSENGYVLRTYDVVSDQVRYQNAATAEDVGVALRQWADTLADNIRAAVEHEIAKAT